MGSNTSSRIQSKVVQVKNNLNKGEVNRVFRFDIDLKGEGVKELEVVADSYIWALRTINKKYKYLSLKLKKGNK